MTINQVTYSMLLTYTDAEPNAELVKIQGGNVPMTLGKKYKVFDVRKNYSLSIGVCDMVLVQSDNGTHTYWIDFRCFGEKKPRRVMPDWF